MHQKKGNIGEDWNNFEWCPCPRYYKWGIHSADAQEMAKESLGWPELREGGSSGSDDIWTRRPAPRVDRAPPTHDLHWSTLSQYSSFSTRVKASLSGYTCQRWGFGPLPCEHWKALLAPGHCSLLGAQTQCTTLKSNMSIYPLAQFSSDSLRSETECLQ